MVRPTPKPPNSADASGASGKGIRPMSPAIEAALRTHYRDFRRFLVSRVGDAAAAEDVLQNFCMRVMQSGTGLRDDKSALGWLYTVLRSVLTDHYRKETRRRGGDAAYVQDQLVLGEQTSETDDSMGLCRCIDHLVLDLRPEYSEVLRRADFAEEPREKLCADLGISQKNLRVRLHRARQAIGELLKGHCGGCCNADFRDCFCAHRPTRIDVENRPGSIVS